MRSQLEILEKIKQIEISRVDPTGLQKTTLTHKLSWDNAKPFVKPEKYNDETKVEWQKHNHLEKKFLLSEMAEQVDYTYMLMAGKEWQKVIASLQVIMIIIWLMQKEHYLGIFIPEMLKSEQDHGRTALRKLCEEFGFNWKLYEMRYLRETEGGIIIPEGTNIEDITNE